MSDVTDLNSEREFQEDQRVFRYLREHPAFFQKHPELLARMRLPHAQRGAISLVERQMEMQRERVRCLEEDIARLHSTARTNEHIFMALNQLHIDMFAAHQLTDVRLALSAFANKMTSIHGCTLLEFNHHAMGQNFGTLQLLLENRLPNKNHYFGRLTKDEMAILFPHRIHSVALLLISGVDQPLALLAFGSELDDHFQPHMDTLFVDHIAKILSVLLPKFLE